MKSLKDKMLAFIGVMKSLKKIEVLAFIAVVITAGATAWFAFSSYQTVKLMELNMALDRAPVIRAALHGVREAEVPKDFTEEHPGLDKWKDKQQEKHYCVILIVQNLQTSPIGSAHAVKVTYKVDFPKWEKPEEKDHVEKTKDIRSVESKKDVTKLLFIFDRMPWFNAEIVKIEFFNPLIGKTEDYTGYLPRGTIEKDKKTGEITNRPKDLKRYKGYRNSGIHFRISVKQIGTGVFNLLNN